MIIFKVINIHTGQVLKQTKNQAEANRFRNAQPNAGDLIVQAQMI